MNIRNYSLINQNPANTGKGCEKISSEKNSKENEPSLYSESPDNLKIFVDDGSENITGDISKVNLHSAEHQPRSRTRNCKPSDPFQVHNCKDRLPSLETEQQFRIAITRCARGGDSVERNPSNGKFSDTSSSFSYGMRVARNVPTLPSLVFKTKPVIISSSPVMKAYFSARAKGVESRRTAGVNAFFTRISTPKYIKGKVRKDKKIGDCAQQMSATQYSRRDATKGLHVNVVHTRSNSIIRSGNRPSRSAK